MSSATTRLSTTWQVTLADLSLILFIISASAVSLEKNKPLEERAKEIAALKAPAKEKPSIAPVALFRDLGEDGALESWLNIYNSDPREQLTIRAIYKPGDMEAVLIRAEELARETKASGKNPRIVVEEGANTDITASFAFEGLMADMAR